MLKRTSCVAVFLPSTLRITGSFRDAFIAARVNQVLSTNPQMMDVSFKNDPLEDRAVEHITTGSQDLVELESLYQGVLDALKNGDSDVVLTVRKFDLKFPMCLSGIG